MKSREGAYRDDESAPRWVDESDDGGVGPQGEALILELQRLRQAFEPEDDHERAAPRRGSRNDPQQSRQGAARPKRAQKGKMQRIIGGWFGQFGRAAATPPPLRRSEPARAPEVRPARRRPGTAAPESPIPTVQRNERPRAPDVPEIRPARRRAGIAGSESPIPTVRRNERPRAPEVPEVRPPRRSGIVGSERPIPMVELGRGRDAPGLEINPPSPAIDTPRMMLPPPAAKAPPTTAVGQAVERARSGLVTGVGFLINRDGFADNDNAPGESLATRAGRAYEHELRTGLRVLLTAIILAGGWAALVPLAGAVVVPGNLVVQSNVKSIQHPTGGVVAEIAVKDGMRVNAGDLLVRLDGTQAQASLQVVSKQLDELRARIARLVAERDGLPELEVPAELMARSGEDAIRILLASEESLFRARTNARRSQIDLLQSRVAQLGEEIGGLDAQVESKAKQLELIGGELSGIQDLFDKHLVPLTRLTTLQRESARIEGERGQLISTIAETKAKIGEAQLQIVRVDQDFRTDVVKELGETRGKEAELVERSVSARDLLDRIELHAPTAGVIHQLSAHTIGGVIRAGDAIMEIVPDTDDLEIEAKLQPADIDQVRTGQKAFVRFSAFNQRVTPQLNGTVSFVSADTSHDQQSTAPFFTVRVTLPDEERHRLEGLRLVSGMPAEVFMQTGSRTMLSYLFKPIADQLQRAFIER